MTHSPPLSFIPSCTRFQNPFRPPPPEWTRFASLFMKEIPPPTMNQAHTLSNALIKGDPLADAWVQHCRNSSQKHKEYTQFNQALTLGIEQIYKPSPSLVALFKHVETQPLWLDPSLLDLGQKTFKRSGFIGDWVLTQVALMGGYRYEGVIQPLLMTGRLTEYAPKRMAETTRFVLDVLSPKGLERGALGYRSAIQVRILHAHIRSHLTPHPHWEHQKWGMPINQADQLSTLLLFSLSFLLSSRFLGMRYTEREALSIIHLWKYVGYLMGIQEHLLPSTEAEARRMFYLIGMTQTLAGDESAQLAQALHTIPLRSAKTGFEKRFARLNMKFKSGISRLFLGDEASDQLGLPTTRLSTVLLAMIPAIFLYETARKRIPRATQLSTHIGGKWQQWHTDSILKECDTLYEEFMGQKSAQSDQNQQDET